MATLTPHTDDLSEFEGLFMRRALFAGLSAVALTFTSTAVASGQETLGELSATTQSSEGEPSRADGIADEAIEELPEGLTLGSQGMQMMSSEDADAGLILLHRILQRHRENALRHGAGNCRCVPCPDSGLIHDEQAGSGVVVPYRTCDTGLIHGTDHSVRYIFCVAQEERRDAQTELRNISYPAVSSAQLHRSLSTVEFCAISFI